MDKESNLLLRRQIETEQDTLKGSADKYDKEFLKAIEKGGGGDTKEAIIIIKASVDQVEDYITKIYKSKAFRGKHILAREVIKTYFSKPRDLAYVLIKHTLAVLLQETTTPLLRFSKGLYKVFSMTAKVISLSKQEPKLYSYIERKYTKSIPRANSKKRRLSRGITIGSIDAQTEVVLGLFLVDIVTKSGCDLITIYKEGQTLTAKVSDNVSSLLLRSKEFFLSKSMVFKPLVYPPLPWKGISGTGGYYSYPNDISLIKTRSSRDFNIIKYELKPDLSRLLDVINKLQEVPFHINKRVLEVITHINKYNLVDPTSNVLNPVLYGGIPYADTLDVHQLIPKASYGELDENNKFKRDEDKFKWVRALEEQDIRIERIRSKRLAFSLALQLATLYSKEDRFYFTYQTDFRGRLYPMQQHLNPQQTSEIKPLLEFADGCVLTPDGFYWLKVHGANCYGYDKLPYTERIQKIEEAHEDIMAVAKDPYGTISLWNDADEPLSYLAFCFSYSKHIIDPTSTCHLPVALDATCSGIQIYSGLLKDKEGAKAVNVIDNDQGKPSDIYKDVAEKVEEAFSLGEYPKTIEYTTKDGERHSTSTLIEVNSLKGKVTRSLTKRNVMTQPYSVTYLGMVQQLKDLLTTYEDDNKIFWKGEKWIIATVLARLNKEAIAEVVKGASIGQQMIKAVLKETLRNTKSAVWLTPIYGFPVVQRIRREKRRQYKSPFGQLVLYDTTNEVHYNKMLNGIAPNYIHSLDATLLYRTVEKCQEVDRTDFMLIHDSFAMKANDIPTMNMMVREAYVELFRGNPLEAWTQQLCPSMVEEVRRVMVDDLDLDEVLESPYIFS